jgi:hypothetical protein
VGCGVETKDLILEDQKGCIRRCEEFKYLGVGNIQISRKNKVIIYNSIVKSTVTYGAQTWKFNKNRSDVHD